MSFDAKKIVEEIADKLKNNPELLQMFQNEPIRALECLTGIDLPDEQLEPVIAAVKARLTTENAVEVLGKLGGLFGKK